MQTLPWPDKLPLLTHALVDPTNPASAAFSNKLLRYAMLAYILCIRRFSKVGNGGIDRPNQTLPQALHKMFPSDQSLTDTRLATVKELSIIK